MVDSNNLQRAQLIGLDWGSTSLRAMMIDEQGAVLSVLQSDAGVSTLNGRKKSFITALDALIGEWNVASLPILACGMVGSQHGWREVPYLRCPANAESLAAATRAVDWHDRQVLIVPGLLQHGKVLSPDVMRGEETQIVGALTQDPKFFASGTCVVMPGTHSKWAHVHSGQVRSFATHMTGELYSVLRKHSVLGRLMPLEPTEDGHAFEAGVRAALDEGDEGLTHQLFAVRTLGLTGCLSHESLPDYLSGLLIGHEVRAGLQWQTKVGLAFAPLLLIGEPALCQRYAKALDLFSANKTRIMPNTAALGLWQLNRYLPAKIHDI